MSAMVRDIDIDLLDRRADARAVDADKVRAIAASLAEVGQINPIRVRSTAGGRFEIVAGVHRVEACRALGLAEIEALVVESGELFAELAMIDENLCRAELGPADRARQTARRKQIYEALHPEARAGVVRAAAANRAMGHNVDANFASTFTSDTAKATGQSERAVQLNAERGAKVIDEVLDLIRGTSLDTGLYLDGLKRLSPNDQVQVAKRDLARARQLAEEKARARIEAKKDRRAEREAELGARQRDLPEGRRYGVILADPEWRFETWSADGMDRAADNHYPTSPLEAIKARGVGSIAADDAVLFLWATAPMLPQALEVMAAWGFAYKSHTIWRKAEVLPFATTNKPKLDRGAGSGALVLGTGYWFRNAHELLLVGTRGNLPAPAMGTQFPSVIDAPPLRHSQKPERFHELIEAYFPSLPKIELNARAGRDGWDVWGLEAPGDELAAGCAPVEPAETQAGDGNGLRSKGEATLAPRSVGSRESGSLADGIGTTRCEDGASPAPPSPFTRVEAPPPPAAPVPLPRDAGKERERPVDEINATIRDGYARNAPIAELMAATGLSKAAVTSRAKRLGLGDRGRQRAAVAEANRRRHAVSPEPERAGRQPTDPPRSGAAEGNEADLPAPALASARADQPTGGADAGQ